MRAVCVLFVLKFIVCKTSVVDVLATLAWNFGAINLCVTDQPYLNCKILVCVKAAAWGLVHVVRHSSQLQQEVTQVWGLRGSISTVVTGNSDLFLRKSLQFFPDGLDEGSWGMRGWRMFLGGGVPRAGGFQVGLGCDGVLQWCPGHLEYRWGGIFWKWQYLWDTKRN